MRESSPPRSTALDRPALGLVMQLVALSMLPGQLSLVAFMLIEGMPEFHLASLATLQLVATGLQLAAGIAISRRAAARPLAAAYCIGSLALAIVAAVLFAVEGEGASAIIVVVVEALPGPLVIVVGSLALRLDRLPDQRSPADVAAVLLVLGSSSLIAIAVTIVNQARMMSETGSSPGMWVSLIWPWVVSGATAVVAIHAGRILLRTDSEAAARRALIRYVLVAIGTAAVLGVPAIVWILVNTDDHKLFVLVSPVAGLAISVARPLLIWSYAKPTLRDPMPASRRELCAPLVWAALWAVPLLLSRWPAVLQIGEASGAAIAVELGVLLSALAVANVVAVLATLRGDRRAFAAALTATASGGRSSSRSARWR
ncbi:MAG: hypothetical protein E6J91_21785 [Deltaproteobacteria bacterium]|nr:MAG: hypothetical protein E6J91_21785 [Deltaproteobacteria bacterium]